MVVNPIATKFAYGNGACPSCGGSQLSALTDPKGNTWTFRYDQYGRLTNTANPLGQAKAYTYDKMSRVAEVKDPAGNITQYTYDALNRLTKKDIAAPAGNHSITDYSYDAVGNLLNIASGGSAVSYTYDQLNRPVSTTQSFDGKAYTLDYAYDAVGNRTTMATPWGKYNYTYDALNRLTGIVNPQGITVAFGYDAAGRRTSKKIFKAAPALLAEAEYSYDAAGQLTEITNKAGGKVVAFNKYQYDANGNRNRIEDQDGIWDYKYDAANRLIVAIPFPVNYVKAEAFVYDKNGNRRYDKTAWDYHYDAANRLVANSTYTYTHDANGNLTARTNRFDNSQFTYAYTPEQQLSDVTTPEHRVQYKYDPLGRRTAKTVDGKTTKFIYDGQDIIAELDDANNQINTYTNGPGIDEPLVMTKPDGKAYYYHADALGSIKAITDDNAAIVETYKYKAYGQPTIRDAKGQPLATSIIGNTRMFAAREYEQEIALYNNRHRYLDPSRGAFTQEDPLGLFADTNYYSYAKHGPLDGKDPDGLLTTDEYLSYKYDKQNEQTSISLDLSFYRNFWVNLFGGVSDFVTNYYLMRKANTINADKYFHCMANCQAAQRGFGGLEISFVIGEARELSDQYLKGDSIQDCNADREANSQGRYGGTKNTCRNTCGSLRPVGLDSQY